MKQFKPVISSRQLDTLAILGLLALSALLLRHFVAPGIMRTHDGEMHLARLANFALAVRDGHLPVRWAPNLNYKFGYPMFNYTYPAIYYLSLIPLALGLSLEAGLKVILFLLFWLSGVGIYLLTKQFVSRSAALVSAIFLLTAPYYLTLIYLRGSIGENLTLALVPWVMYLAVKLAGHSTRVYFSLFTLVSWGFLLSHNILVMLTTPILLLCLALAIYFNIIKQYKLILAGIILAVLGSMFFWLPAVMEKGLVNLEAYNPAQLLNHFVYLNQFTKPIWQYGYSVAGNADRMSFYLGWGAVLVLVLAARRLAVVFRTKQSAAIGSLTALTISLVAVLMMTSISRPLWQHLPFLGYAQFPWRFMSIFILSVSVLVGLVTHRWPVWLKLSLVVLVLVTIWPQTTPLRWGTQPNWFYFEYPFTASTKNEMTPRGFDITKYLEYQDRLRGIVAPITITGQQLKTQLHTYRINSPVSNQLADHTAYFPGWTARVNGRPVEIDFRYPDYQGLITVPVPPGESQVIIKFGDNTWPRRVGDWLSMAGFAFFVLTLTLWPVPSSDNKHIAGSSEVDEITHQAATKYV